jgi:cytochrome c peroxidase
MMPSGTFASLTNLRATHRLSWICVCVAVGVVVGGVAAGQGPPRLGEASETGPVHDQEPIRPIPPPPAADPLKLALGERLFTDPRLSANGTLTCASCHDIHTNGASGGPRKAAPDGSKPIDTLTVFNAALNFRLNWEGNYRALAAHAESSLENPVNLNTSVDEVVRKLNADPQIVGEFRATYGGAPDRNSFLNPGDVRTIAADARKPLRPLAWRR